MIQQAIKKVIGTQDLSRREAELVMDHIMSGKATPAQIGGLLVALHMKGETIDEITGFALAMREKSLKISPKVSTMIDTCGTGGDYSGTFNISTAAAFVVSAAGVAVAKHGNRSMSSKSGSADVMEALGIRIELPLEGVEKCIEDIGIGFMFAPYFHPAMKYAVGPRKELGVRTVFNVLGPLTNPASASCQLMGVFDRSLTEPLANVLLNLGIQRGMVVHGLDGLDEITITDETQVSEIADGRVQTYTISPEQFGIARVDMGAILGGDAQSNAKIVREILSGKTGPKSDIVVLNAGAAIYVGGGADSIVEGIARAKALIEDGSALSKMQAMIQYTNTYTGGEET